MRRYLLPRFDRQSQFPRPSRRGMTAVLAMLYLSLFSTLALGFYSAVTTSVKVSSNEQNTARALLAAESGMAFAKYHLANLGIPPNTPTDQLFTKVHERLASRLNGWPNMKDENGAYHDVALNSAEDTIAIPSGNTWINSDAEGKQFRIRITKQQNGQQLRVKVSGRLKTASTIVESSKATQLDYSIAKDAAKIFDYGVASKSAISMNGTVSIVGVSGHDSMGSVLSATTSTNTPLTMTGNSKISGDVSFVNPNASTSGIGSNASIAGYTPSSSSFAEHVHTDVPEVPFPTIDTSAFKQYATTKYVSSMGSTLTNVWLPPGNYSFNNAIVTGIVYVYQPSTISFQGQSTIHGVIVADNAKVGTYTTNTISFKSVDAIPINVAPFTDIPAGLQALTGSFILMDNFHADFGGNFNTVSGSIIASKIDFSGTAGGTIKGSVINLEDSAVTLGGSADLVIESQGTSNYPAGVFFGSHYSPLPYTYAEVTP